MAIKRKKEKLREEWYKGWGKKERLREEWWYKGWGKKEKVQSTEVIKQ